MSPEFSEYWTCMLITTIERVLDLLLTIATNIENENNNKKLLVQLQL
jgi:hypothetical protein